MAKATIKEQKKARKSAKKTQVQFKDKYPYLHQFQTWEGPFRRRTLAWEYGTVLALNPYTMGVVSVYTTECHNLIPLITGAGLDMLTSFKPPEQWQDAFREAYKLIKSWSAFITWDEGYLVEYQIDDRGIPTFRLLLESEYQRWEDRLRDAAPALESIHDMITGQRVNDEGAEVIQPVLSLHQ